MGLLAGLLALSGCGGGSSGTATLATPKPATTPPATTTQAGQSRDAKPKKALKLAKAPPVPKSAVARALAKAPQGPPPKRLPTPVPKQGDKSIQTYGAAAPQLDFAAVARTVRAFNYALAAHDAQSVCALLASGVRSQILTLAAHAKPAKATSCATAISGLLRPQAPAVAKQLRAIRVTDARIKGKTGFVIYKLPGEGEMAQAVAREASGWKVASMGGVPLQ